MRHVYTAELARLRYCVVNCRTGALIAAFAFTEPAHALRDIGPRNLDGSCLYEVSEQEPKVTKPRLRQRRRAEPRQREALTSMFEPESTNYYRRSL